MKRKRSRISYERLAERTRIETLLRHAKRFTKEARRSAVGSASRNYKLWCAEECVKLAADMLH